MDVDVSDTPIKNNVMDNYRSLTVEEITVLERGGCTAPDWTRISVTDGFGAEYVRNVAFYGDVCLGAFDKQIEVDGGFMRHSGIRNATLCDVVVGDNCLIENIGSHICRYVIGEECYISNVGLMTTGEGATYGEGNAVPVLNEAGDGNVIIYDCLTSQMAAFMVAHNGDSVLWQRMCELAGDYLDGRASERGVLGYGVKIVNTGEIVNARISDECEISGAARIADCTLMSIPEASIFIGNGVICENTVVQAGSSVLSGARLYNCFVGEACHIGKGFSAENSLFFANSYMDNGEACSAFCGPFTVSHHKSTLLIGGQYSFYNAGSATNFSNHAYKLGPVHCGLFGRGTKTASGAHLLLPARVGAFSVCIGKIESHPDIDCLPFSYVIGSGGATHVVPGRNLMTSGTYRDTAKWGQRDKRPRSGRQSIVNFDWLSPYTAGAVMRGKRTLEALLAEQGEADTYSYGGCLISRKALQNGMRYYDMALRLYMGEAVRGHYCELPENSIGTEEWADLGGLLVPETEVRLLAEDIKSGALDELQMIEDRFLYMSDKYEDYKWNFTYRLILDYFGLDTLTDDDLRRVTDECGTARQDWLGAVRRDAEKDFELGDVPDSMLSAFIEKLV